jgi:HEAT repeat protein
MLDPVPNPPVSASTCRWIALLLVLAACAKRDEAWLAELSDPDPFVRALAAIALCEQSPERASSAVPVLLDTIDRSELRLRPKAAAALARVGGHVVDALVRSLVRDELMTAERREAVLAALVAAGPAAIPALRTVFSHPDPAVRDAAGEALRRIENNPR